ncbi:hypothetical protein CGU36_27145, partial [Pseudomonas fluorescens]
MRIFKFGGASVKDANGVRNVVNVLRITGFRDLGVVVSAMGKTTNALEEILARYQKNDNSYLKLIDKLYEQHNEVIVELEEVTDFINEDEVLRFRESGIATQVYAFGHVADGNIHLMIGKNDTSKATKEAIDHLVYQEIETLNGSVSAEHGIGNDKKAY